MATSTLILPDMLTASVDYVFVDHLLTKVFFSIFIVGTMVEVFSSHVLKREWIPTTCIITGVTLKTLYT